MLNMKLKPSLLAVLSVIAATSAAYAADVVNLDKIEVVSSTPLGSTGVPVNETPTNVQVLNSSDIKEQGSSNVADLINANIGSVSVSNGSGSPYQNDVSYRGFQATSLLGAPVGLSVYFDGVRFNEPFGSTINWDLIPMNAISGINLMPGSNPLFGLNTLGGALAINTKNGADNQGLSVTLLGGSYGRAALNAEYGAVDKDYNMDYFVAVNKDRQDGWRDHSGSDVQQLFGKVRWHSDDDKSNLALSMALADNTLHGTQSLPLDMLSTPKAAYTWPDTIGNRMAMINLKGSTWLSDTKMIAGNVYYRKQDSNSLNSNAQLDDGCGSGCTNSAPNGTALDANASISNNTHNLQSYTGDINTSNVYSTTHQDTVGGNFQLSIFDNLLAHENNLTVGAAADHSHISYNQNTELARLINYQAVTTQNLGYWVNGGYGSNLISNVNLTANTDNFSIFGTDNFKVNDKFNVTASGSYNIAFIDQSGANKQFLNTDGGYSWSDASGSYYNPDFIGAQYYRSGNLSTVTTPASPAVAGPEDNSLNGTHRYSRFNPAIGFNYNPEKELNFFGGYNESMRAPTPIELSCANPASPCNLPTGFNGDPDLKKVVAKTWEAGARGRLFNKVTWNFAVYDTTTYNDIQFITANNTQGYFSNVGETERKGFELGAQAKFDKLFLAANYGYVDATYQSEFDVTSSSNSSADANGAIHVSKGNKIPGIADQTLKVRAAYDVTPSWKIGSNVMLVAGQYAHGDENNQDSNGKIPGYGVVNLDTQLNLNDNWTAFGVVNNLFDKDYYTYGLVSNNVYNNTDTQFRTPAMARSAWVGLTYNFGGAKKSAVELDKD